jgi:hypothetical protein
MLIVLAVAAGAMLALWPRWCGFAALASKLTKTL